MDEANTVENRLLGEDFLLLLPIASWVGDVVFVIDGETARDGLGIEAATILEGGVRGEDGKLRLQLGLHSLILLLLQLPSAQLLQRILDLGTNQTHLAALDGFSEKFGGANLHLPTSYTS